MINTKFVILLVLCGTYKQSYQLFENQLFSTHTRYNTVRGSIIQQEGCQAKSLWGFMRHGIRYPPVKKINYFKQLEGIRDLVLANHQKNLGHLLIKELEALGKWKCKLTENDHLHLTPSGNKEHQQLGQRLRNTFPELFNSSNQRNIKIKRTTEYRTRESAAAMYLGIFNKTIPDYSEPTINNQQLWLESSCKSWRASLKSKILNKEAISLKSSILLQSLLKSVSRRLGFKENFSYGTVFMMYDLCSYEASWYKESPWCSVFSTKELEIFEYLEDLTFYWTSGFGNPYSKNLGCLLLSDMISNLESSKNNGSVMFNFAHEQAVRALLVSLGIGDCPQGLHAQAYIQGTQRRDCWRTSSLVPFAANIISVLYSCESDTEDTKKIGIYLNEKLVPVCYGEKLCDFETFKEKFSLQVNPGFCNRNFCDNFDEKLINTMIK